MKEEVKEKDELKIPAFKELMVSPEMIVVGEDDIVNFYNTTGASTRPFELMRAMAANAATDEKYTDALSNYQLNTLGDTFNYAYIDTLKFYLSELVFTNVMTCIHQSNIPTDFLEKSNIRENIYNVLYDNSLSQNEKSIIFRVGSLYRAIHRITDPGVYMIQPQLNKLLSGDNDYYNIDKQGAIAELSVLTDLYVRNTYTKIMYAIDYTCNAFFYNFGCKYSINIIDNIVDFVINMMRTVNESGSKRSPFEIIDRYTYACTTLKGYLSNNLFNLFTFDLNHIIASVLLDERIVPNNIFKSLSTIGRIEDIEEKRKEMLNDKNAQIINVAPANYRDSVDELPFV